jgi:DNA uptake protein ComE-like DNA-binding protein
MGLQDREYMRRRTHEPRRRVVNWRTWLFTAGSIIAVASAAIWLVRDFRSLVPDSTPGEGSLVVNINKATQAEIETVPGIGPALAARVVAGRPYNSVDDLLRRSGIGKRTLATMRPFLKTDGETQPR